jgi:hypothetical protein
MLFSDLTPAQQAQATQELFFGDAFFGFDPAHFNYEVDAAGRVTGRVELNAAARVKRQQIRNQPLLFRSFGVEVDQDRRYRLEAGARKLIQQVAVSLVQELESVHAV